MLLCFLPETKRNKAAFRISAAGDLWTAGPPSVFSTLNGNEGSPARAPANKGRAEIFGSFPGRKKGRPSCNHARLQVGVLKLKEPGQKK